MVRIKIRSKVKVQSIQHHAGADCVPISRFDPGSLIWPPFGLKDTADAFDFELVPQKDHHLVKIQVEILE